MVANNNDLWNLALERQHIDPLELADAVHKDLDDLRALAPQLDKNALSTRLRETTAALMAAEGYRPRAEKNWYIVYGEPLPT